MKIKPEDKRNNPRLEVYHLAKYSVVSDSSQKKPVLAYIKNISGGGVCIQTEEPLPVGSLLQLRINMPLMSKPVTSIAKVAWSKKASKKGFYEAGIHFLEIEEAVREAIKKGIYFAKEASEGKRKRQI